MSALTTSKLQRLDWKTIAIGAITFWISGSLLLDLVIMPTMFATGMMAEPGFATAGYSLFGVFNRIELICAATALSGVLFLQNRGGKIAHWTMPLAIGLLGIAMICTYGLAPVMSALDLQLDLFEPAYGVPNLMSKMHVEYWVLEAMKLLGSGLLLRQFYRAVS